MESMTNMLNKNNKKAQLGSDFLFGLIGFLITIVILVSLVQVQEANMPIEDAVNILNTTQYEMSQRFAISNITLKGGDMDSVIKVVYKFIDFTMYSTLEIAKLGLVAAHEHLPPNSARLLIYIVLFGLIAPIIFILLKIIILLIIIFYDLFRSIKDKKEIRRLRRVEELQEELSKNDRPRRKTQSQD